MCRGEKKNKKRSKKKTEKKVERKYGGVGVRAVLVEKAGLGECQ